MTKIDADAKRTLDLRLAKGEIDSTEYQRLLRVLVDSVDASPRLALSTERNGAELLWKLGDLEVFATHLSLRGARREFSEIKKINGGHTELTINFTRCVNNSWLRSGFLTDNGTKSESS